MSREISGGGCSKYTYRAVKADRRAKRKASKRKSGKRKFLLNRELKKYIVTKLKLCWSPEQIAETLKTEYSANTAMRISPEAIYAVLYILPKGTLKKELLSCLRRGHKRRRRRKKGEQPLFERKIENMILIDERPEEVAERIVPGHWEGDLLIGKNRQSAMGSLTERTTRKAILVPLKSKSSEEVRIAFEKEFDRLPESMRLTLTYDQGREMTQHEALARRTKVKVYFAHKASPWERGTNENTNGLIRQFFPKGTDFSKVSRREIKRAEKLLNGRPRKVLN
ncbi:MAG: IS30 family transposase [Candidatus Portnoybacteria bacterium]|nr:IS30 family transposase [Candidatus Portnoybacteria bacterium]